MILNFGCAMNSDLGNVRIDVVSASPRRNAFDRCCGLYAITNLALHVHLLESLRRPLGKEGQDRYIVSTGGCRQMSLHGERMRSIEELP